MVERGRAQASGNIKQPPRKHLGGILNSNEYAQRPKEQCRQPFQKKKKTSKKSRRDKAQILTISLSTWYAKPIRTSDGSEARKACFGKGLLGG
jgi:hypothetical protein